MLVQLRLGEQIVSACQCSFPPTSLRIDGARRGGGPAREPHYHEDTAAREAMPAKKALMMTHDHHSSQAGCHKFLLAPVCEET